MKLLRTLSTPRLLAVVAVVVAIAAGSAALAVAAGRGGPTPPSKDLATAVHDALSGSAPAGITARIAFTNNLFPSGALTGATGSALLSSASGRLWATADGRGRLELTSNAGDVQIVWNAQKAWAYDASSNTVYTFTLPASSSKSSGGSDASGPPALSQITSFLTRLSGQADVSTAQPDNVGHQPAYTVQVSPKHDGGLLGSAQLAFDAANGTPLRVAIYAQGSSTPALALEATDISFGAVDSSAVDISPPAGAHVVDLSSATAGARAGTGTKTPDANTLPAVQAAVDFPVAAPDTLVGLPRKSVGLAGKDAAVVVYGQGLGAIVLIERKVDGSKTGMLSGVPAVSIGGANGHELATQLGTVIEWQSSGRAIVLAGSLPPSAAEAAAREVK